MFPILILPRTPFFGRPPPPIPPPPPTPPKKMGSGPAHPAHTGPGKISQARSLRQGVLGKMCYVYIG